MTNEGGRGTIYYWYSVCNTLNMKKQRVSLIVHKIMEDRPRSLLLSSRKVEFVGLLIVIELVHSQVFFVKLHIPS